MPPKLTASVTPSPSAMAVSEWRVRGREPLGSSTCRYENRKLSVRFTCSDAFTFEGTYSTVEIFNFDKDNYNYIMNHIIMQVHVHTNSSYVHVYM